MYSSKGLSNTFICMYVSIGISVHAYIVSMFLSVCLAVNANILVKSSYRSSVF